MKCLIIVYSYHHNNTLKVANAIAEGLKAVVKTPQEVSQQELQQYDLIGLGAGIDSGRHYKELLDFAEGIQKSDVSQKSFIFSTSGVQGERKVYKDHKKLRDMLVLRNYEILGEFSCKGFNTNSILKYIGGMNKVHPNTTDIKNAKQFANELLRKVGGAS